MSSKNSTSSTYLLTMPFAVNCRLMKGFPSEDLVVISDRSSCDVGGVGGELQELHVQFLIRRYSPAF